MLLSSLFLISIIHKCGQIKADVDAIECKKDEEARRFQSHDIEFDFDVLLRIKEFMVDVSSNCIEMVLKVCDLTDLCQRERLYTPTPYSNTIHGHMKSLGVKISLVKGVREP